MGQAPYVHRLVCLWKKEQKDSKQEKEMWEQREMETVKGWSVKVFNKCVSLSVCRGMLLVYPYVNTVHQNHWYKGFIL